MVLTYVSLFLGLNLFSSVFGNPDILNSLPKCDIEDGECAKSVVRHIFDKYSKTGAESIGLPPLDPIPLNNITVKLIDIVELTLKEGIVKGAKDCQLDKFNINIKKGHVRLDLTCDVTVKGKYHVYSSSPIIQSLLGASNVTGDGNGKMKIEKLKLKFDFRFFIQNRNGDLYIKCRPEKTKYDFDIKGNLAFAADDVWLGDKESSAVVVKMLNENWRLLMSSFGRLFMDECVPHIYFFLHKFFDNVPCKYFITTDLTPYVKE